MVPDAGVNPASLVTLPDLGHVRRQLQAHCDNSDPAVFDALNRLEINSLKLTEEGPAQYLFEALRNDGRVLYLGARRVRPAKGLSIAAKQNRNWRRETGAESSFGFRRVAFFDPELQLLFEVFPLDHRMPSLPIAADGRRLAPVIESLLAPNGGRVKEVAAVPMRYKPGRKCMLRYEITWSTTNTGPTVVYGKIARARSFATTRSILTDIGAAARRVEFDLPKPLGIAADLCVEFYSEVAGKPLAELTGGDRFAAHCARTARALHQFHSLPVTMARHWDVPAKLARLADDASGLGRLFPGQSRLVRGLYENLRTRLQVTAPRSRQPTLIHRDFHGTNVLVDGDRIGLIDLEDCALGDPAEDVGSMCAYLSRLEAERPSETTALRLARKAFLGAYPGALATPPNNFRDSVAAHAALYCFFQAYQQVRHPHVRERYRNTELLLANCQRILAQGLSGG